MDGSETNINSSPTVTVAGIGTTADPFILTSAGGADGSETIINASPSVAVTGAGTTPSPYVLTVDGSETIINSTPTVTVTGNGTIGSPYELTGAAGAPTAADVTFDPYLTLGSLDTQGAIEELKDELTAAILLAGASDPNDELITSFALNGTGLEIAENTNVLPPVDLNLVFATDAELLNFTPDWTSLTNRPIGLDDGDDDTTYTAGAGLVLSPANEFSVNAATIVSDWSNLTNIPVNLDTDSTNDFDGDWTSLTNRPIGLDDGDDDTTYTAGAGLVLSPANEFSVNAATIVSDWSNLTNIPVNLDTDSTNDFDGDWTSLTNRPIGLDDGDDDTIYTAGAGLVLSPANEFSVDAATIVSDWSNLTNIPVNLDTDSTNDFDGDWMSLTNRPIGFDDGDDDTTYTAGTGIAISGTNQITVDGGTIVADWGNLTGIPINIDTDSTDDFDGEWTSLNNRPLGLDDGDDDTQYTAGAGIAISGTNQISVDGGTIVADWGNLTGIPINIDTDSTDDFDGEWTSLNNRPLGLDDGDDDTQYTAGAGIAISGTNQISVDGDETIVTQGANITITGNGTTATPYVINASGTIGTNWTDLVGVPAGFVDNIDNDTQLTDVQVATAVNSQFPNLDTDVTDDFDGEWTSLNNRPIGLDDGDDDTQYTAGAGIAISGTNQISVDGGTIVADWGNLTGIPINIDTDSTDDFDGEWTSLNNRPLGLDDGDDDTQYTAGAGIAISGTNQISVDGGTIVADWGNLTGIPINIDTDSTDDFDGDWTSLTNRPIGLDDGDDDTTYTAGTGIAISGTNQISVDGGTIVADWANLTGIPINIDTDSTDDFDGEWTSLNNRPLGLDDGDDDTQYTAGAGIAISGTNQISVDGNTIPAGAIDGTKVVPNFGSQNIITTGNLTVNGPVTVGGTPVHPDYVFQKYFLGNSSLKENYDFPSLERN